MIRLVQVQHPASGRGGGLVENGKLRLFGSGSSIYSLSHQALSRNLRLEELIRTSVTDQQLDYDSVYSGSSDWRLLPSFDHPDEPARCLVTGTGLTHKKSADNRQAMHAAAGSGLASSSPLTDSMRMYQWGIEGGRPATGAIGVAPEWFYKGCGTILRAHGEPLDVPPFALDGGEEAEVAGVYLIDPEGNPRRVGFTIANEFSDHVIEQKNYLYLAHSKLCTCAIGPELIVNGDFSDLLGTVSILRDSKVVWSQSFATGDKSMSHALPNLEHHHFKYPAHRRPGDVHIHFFGADAFSFGAGIKLEDGDIMQIDLPSFGRSLRNPIRIDRSEPKPLVVQPL